MVISGSPWECHDLTDTSLLLVLTFDREVDTSFVVPIDAQPMKISPSDAIQLQRFWSCRFGWIEVCLLLVRYSFRINSPQFYRLTVFDLRYGT